MRRKGGPKNLWKMAVLPPLAWNLAEVSAPRSSRRGPSRTAQLLASRCAHLGARYTDDSGSVPGCPEAEQHGNLTTCEAEQPDAQHMRSAPEALHVAGVEGSKLRAGGVGSSSQDYGSTRAALGSTEAAAVGDRAACTAQPPAAAVDDLLDQLAGDQARLCGATSPPAAASRPPSA